MDERWKCARCGVVIGMYEPAIVLDESGERHTSRMSEPGSAPPLAAYHAACREPGAIPG